MSSIREFDHLKVPLDAIKLATNNFSAKNYISHGGFEKVYKGKLVHRGESVMVAIKRLDRAFGQGTPEFWKEIMMLSRYRHTNIVSLLGFCDEGHENILVYEYLSKKSLNMYLIDTNLSWIQRLKICIGAARGLEYLHNPSGTMQRVLHRDIKSSNILLDENWNPKISDFGLSKFGPANQEYTFLFSNAVGTFGYCDPLYIDKGFLTKESDIYSFGVVLFEVLCGRLSIMNYHDSRRFLSKLVENCYKQKKIDTIIPKFLRDQIEPNCLHTYTRIAHQCLSKVRNERPSAAHIVKQLEIALQYQCTPSTILEYPSLLQNERKRKNTVAATVQTSAHARARVHTQAVSGAYSFRPRTRAVSEYFDIDEKQKYVIEAMKIQRAYVIEAMKIQRAYVIEAMKIQRAYRCYRKRKMAAALIQYVFRKWKTKKDYKRKRYKYSTDLNLNVNENCDLQN